MTDASTQALANLNAQLDKLIALVSSGTANATQLAAAQQEISDLQAGINAAAAKAAAAVPQ